VPELWRCQFIEARELPGQGLCGVQRFIFSCGLLTELTFDGYSYDYTRRYCYHLASHALEALRTWDGKGDPPGEWIKEKVSGRHGRHR
jgi:hypothetical protein